MVIFKTILFIILILLALLLLCLFLVLVVPFSYVLEEEYGENHKTFIKVSWLYSLLSVSFSQENKDKKLEVKILFFKLKDFLATKSNKKTVVKKGKKKKIVKRKVESKKTSAFDAVKEVLEYPDFKEIFTLFLEFANKNFKLLRPKKFILTGIVGFDDPSTTGLFFAFLNVLLSCINLDVRLSPDFCENTKSINLYAEGYITTISFLLILFPFALKKPVLKFIKKLLSRRKEDIYESRV